ncbi:H-NS family nucleoid-associated regulatory protein [Cupriavidus necator]|uniref:H-NS family nucleoid-associated regulatory protein n=1 Tax=Cupriavidus necator TaxID=106590 RepID=UPI0039C48525
MYGVPGDGRQSRAGGDKWRPPPLLYGSGEAHPICFRDAAGHSWDGRGDLPEWLQRAVNAGQAVDNFRVS